METCGFDGQAVSAGKGRAAKLIGDFKKSLGEFKESVAKIQNQASELQAIGVEAKSG